jgi:hypothetical protein
LLPFASSAVLVIGSLPRIGEPRSDAIRVVNARAEIKKRNEGTLASGQIWTVLLQFPLEKTGLSDEVNEGL